MAEQNTDTSEVKKKEKPVKKRSWFRRIVNIFLYFFLGIIVLLLIVLGITQTSFFREFLRETVIEQANASLNGTVYIEKIEGTILTSILLRNTVVNMGADTLLKAQLIEVKTSPLQILMKKIKVREVLIKNTQIRLVEDSAGILNISKLVPPSTDTTAGGEFPFNIEVADFKLVNVDFSMQRFDYINSIAYYDSLNMNDLRIKNFNLALYAFADINDNEYELQLKSLSLNSNVNNLNLKNLSAVFNVTPEEIVVNKLYLETPNSDALLSVNVRNFNLFDSTAVDRLGEATLDLSLRAGRLNTADLVPFIPSMKQMNGSIASELEISGALNDLMIDNIQVNYLNTQLALNGSVKNLLDADNMYINAAFHDTYVNLQDLKGIMPGLEIPGAKELGLLRLDTLTYEGSPQNFKTNLLLRTDKGTIAAKGSLDMRSPLMVYDLNLQTNNLDISPFAGVHSSINLRGTIQGKGTSPGEMEARVNLIADGSTIDGNRLDTMRLNAEAGDRLIEYRLVTTSDSMSVNLDGNVNFTDEINPAYQLDAQIKNLNVARFTKDTSETDVNINITAEGENFDPELMNLYLSLLMYDSQVQGIPIDSIRAIVDLRRDDGGQRVINLISDLADITFIGNFSVPRTIELMSREAKAITSIMNDKLNQLMPQAAEETNVSTASAVKQKKIDNLALPDTLTRISYLVDLKNLDLLSLFMGGNRIEVDGEMSGEIDNRLDSLRATFNAAIDYVKFWGGDEIFFLSNLNLDLIVANQLHASTLDDIYADLSLSTDRIFAGTDILGLGLNMKLEDQVVRLDFGTQIEDYAATRITGDIDLSGSQVNLALDTLRLNYNNYVLQNDSLITLSYSQAGINIEHFVLARNQGNISIAGTLGESGNQNLEIAINNLGGRDIAENLLMTKQNNSFNASLNMLTKISGNFADPVFDVHFQVDSVNYQNRNFGSLITDLDYKSKNLAVDINFVDSIITANKPALQLSGNVPVNLALSGVEERFSPDANMNLTLKADNFNLAAFGNLLPVVKKLRGSLAADVSLTGNPDNLNPNGFIRLSDAGFLVDMNNLEYNAALKVSVTPEYISLDTLMIKNADGVEGGGTMTGSGRAELENLSITSSQFNISGELKVLDDISKSASIPAYGDLVIGTRGNVEFIANENGTKLTAPITIKRGANITIPPSRSAYQNRNASFVYKFVEDTSITGPGTGPDFETLVTISKERSAEQQSAKENSGTFDFTIDLEIEDEATVVFVLSREINQNLTAVLGGNLIYESIGGRSNAQGELRLLDGSTLEFIKTLEADGTIRFENELSDPYLDITATYLDYFNEAGIGEEDKEVPVAVKIKIKGLLSELDKTLMNDENSIAVYYGQENIDNDSPSPEYDKSDAFYFIITGDFVSNQSAEGQGNFATEQATAIAGSVLGGFLNKQFGDYVKSVEVRQSSSGETVFNLAGRWKDFRYSIGGSQKVFQDLSTANVRIEYPIIEKLLLRLERKEDITSETSSTTNMVNELGLRYKFEF